MRKPVNMRRTDAGWEHQSNSLMSLEGALPVKLQTLVIDDSNAFPFLFNGK